MPVRQHRLFPARRACGFSGAEPDAILIMMQVIDKIRQNQIQELQFAQIKTICLEAAYYSRLAYSEISTAIAMVATRIALSFYIAVK